MKTPKSRFFRAAVCTLAASLSTVAQEKTANPKNATNEPSARTILQKYASAWRGREELPLDQQVMLVFWVRGDGGGEYHITLTDEPAPAVAVGAPANYDLGFEMDTELLRRIDRGEMNALTAMGQSSDRDVAPLVWKQSKRFTSRPGAEILFRRLSFFFWNRDWPPTVRFGEGLTRRIHGADAVLLLYEDRFRSAYYQLRPGMHIFPGGQKAPFAILLLCTKGDAMAKFDGKERALSEGEAIFIPSGMTFEYWATPSQYAEVIWIALGDGA